MVDIPSKYAHSCDEKKLGTLFYEPSTRARMSFEATMYELGGNVISMASAASSSASKGEGTADTERAVGCYADIIAMGQLLRKKILKCQKKWLILLSVRIQGE